MRPRPMCIFICLFVAILRSSGVVRVPHVQALNNGLAKVPPMGWNSWNTFHCNVDQDLIVETALKIKELGLDELGYRYVNIDDCWMSMFRTRQGKLIGDHKRFSKGMKWMGDFLHDQGLFFGIYSSAGVRTCAGYPASLGHETVDATSFAEWGVDFLKYDNCFNLGMPSIDRYSAMRDALNATGRPIVYSLCQWGTEESWQWAKQFGNSWRTTGDITARWSSIEGCFWQSQQHFEQSGPGGWLDPDMLEVGHEDLTVLEENKSHFALWVLAKAPLLLGNDLTKPIRPEILEILKNKNLIEIHQDPHTPQATCYYGCDRDHLWCAPAVDGEHVAPQDTYTCTLDETALQHRTEPDYSIFATTRGGSHQGDTTVAMIINWHPTQVLSVQKLNVVQLLGISPSPTQRVVITDLWTSEPVSKQDSDATTNNDQDNPLQFSFEDLKHVSVPKLKPHDCLVYSFTIVTTSPDHDMKDDDCDQKTS